MKISEGQSFSITDLSTNHLQNTGIVFPLASANDKPNFAGILHHRGPGRGNVSVAHFEYRLANGTIDAEKQTAITYTEGRCLSYVTDTATSVSAAETLAGVLPTKSDYVTLSNAESIQDSPLIAKVLSAWSADRLIPTTSFVDPTNIIKKTYIPYTINTQAMAESTTKTQMAQDMYILAAKAIKWYEPLALSTMSVAQLTKEVRELSKFYHEVEEDIEIPLTKQGLLTEYAALQNLITDEVSYAEEEAAYLSTIDEEELNHMNNIRNNIWSKPTLTQKGRK